MEEKQIQEFVHRVSQDEALRKEFTSNPDSVIMRENFSPRVASIVKRIAPQLAAGQFSSEDPLAHWWQY